MTFPPEVWNGVLRRISSELPAHSIEAWLLPLDPAANSEGGLQLLCPSSFHRDRVRDRFLNTIVACLRQELGDDTGVTLGLKSKDALSHPSTPRGTAAGRANSQGGRTGPHSPDSAEPTQAPAGGNGAAAMKLVRPEGSTRSSDGPGSATKHAISSQSSQSSHSNPSGRTRQPRRRPTPPSAGLRFDNFVVGPCNSLAREASMALANEGRGLTQLYLSSPHGLGKTHLARAVVAEARRQDSARVLYASAESFTSEFMSSIQNKKTSGFKQRWRRECDVLVIEDIQFLVGKRATQLELFHTVQHVLDRGRRVLLTGDRPAHALGGLDERVLSQLSGGFTATLDQPDAALRCDILRAKASAGGVRVPDDCLELIVQSVSGSVRELEGALIQIVTTASLLKRSIDLALTRESLARTRPRPTRTRPTPGAIIKAVASFFQTTPEQLSSRSRRRDILVPRQLAMYFSHRYTDASLGEIGKALGRDHPSVRNAISRIERAILERAPLRYKVEALSERLDQLGLGEDPVSEAPRTANPAASKRSSRKNGGSGR